MSNSTSFILENYGYCPICEKEVKFFSKEWWLRDHYFCSNCGSIPRERALMAVIISHYPQWRQAIIHESSPFDRGASIRLKNECKNYILSHYYIGEELGQIINGIRCENLESLTFEDECIDLHITQDVFEHVFNPLKAFSEISRTLNPGGMHIFTVPLVNKMKPSHRRADISPDGKGIHYVEPCYHGSPVGDGRSLVTIDWGYDICNYIFQASGLFTKMIYIDDIGRGIRAEFIEVLVTFKPLTELSLDLG